MSAGHFLPITEPRAQMRLPPCLLGKHTLCFPAGPGKWGEGRWLTAEPLRRSPLEGLAMASHVGHGSPLLWEAQGRR